MAMVIGGSRRVRSRLAALGAAAVTSAVLVAGPPAPGARADVTFGAVATGPLFRAAQVAGVTTVDIDDVDVIGTIHINLGYAPMLPTVLADSINAFPFAGFAPVVATFKRQPGGSLGAAILGGSGLGAYNAGLAYEALLASAAGNTPAGYPPLVPGGTVNSLTGESCSIGPTCVQATNVTNLAVAEVNNPGTPNGGLFARFAPILNVFGVSGVSRSGESASSTGLALNAVTVGLALGYNAVSDFPATLNPVSLLNSVVATLLPTHLLSGTSLAGDSDSEIYAKLGALATLNVSSSTYSTLVSADLPLLEPLRVPSRIVNAVFGALGLPLNLGTPLADALQPALSILVNTGYTDVQTPTDGGLYNRTYDQSGTYVPLLSQAPLTLAEWRQVPGDVARALVVGFQDAFPILRFGGPAPVLTVDGDHLAISYPTPPAATAKQTRVVKQAVVPEYHPHRTPPGVASPVGRSEANGGWSGVPVPTNRSVVAARFHHRDGLGDGHRRVGRAESPAGRR